MARQAAKLVKVKAKKAEKKIKMEEEPVPPVQRRGAFSWHAYNPRRMQKNRFTHTRTHAGTHRHTHTHAPPYAQPHMFTHIHTRERWQAETT